ncbi:MAG: hypothetical protein ABIR54_23315 [Burkholderiaceae bacterium]
MRHDLTSAAAFPVATVLFLAAVVGVIFLVSWIAGRITKNYPPMSEESEWDARNG